ncbi:MAG TPA: hypothetical protein VGC93_15760, partial [Thermoanaerobaculia bacterium]
ADYTVEVRYKDHSATQAVRVLPDPRFAIAEAERRANWEAVARAGGLQEEATAAIERLRRTRADVDTVVRLAKAAQEEAKAKQKAAGAEGEPPHRDLLKAAKTLKEALTAMERRLWVPPRSKGIQDDRTPWARIGFALRTLQSSFAAPSPAQQAHLEAAARALAAVLPDVDRLYAGEVASFRAQARAAGLELLAAEEGGTR